MIRAGVTISCILLLIQSTLASAQAVSNTQASRDTEIKNLLLVDSISDVNIGYVETDTTPGNGKYLCGGMSSSAANSASATVRRALANLPESVLSKVQLKYIIICSRALASGKRIGGIPVPPLNLLMLSVGGSADHSERTVLHELYHMIEYRFGTINDVEWRRRFGQGYANAYASHLQKTALGSGKSGFVNSYSETFPHEDRAELFAFLVLQSAQLAEHADDMVNEKIQYMINKCTRMLDWAPGP